MLKDLGELESDPAQLREALTAFREVLKEYTRDKLPADWAATQYGIGKTLLILGQLESDPAQLKDAIKAFRDYLDVYVSRRAEDPLPWATTQYDLGTTLKLLGEQESNTARLKEAGHAYEAALLAYRSAKADSYVQITERDLQRVRDEIRQRESAKSKDGKKAR